MAKGGSAKAAKRRSNSNYRRLVKQGKTWPHGPIARRRKRARPAGDVERMSVAQFKRMTEAEAQAAIRRGDMAG